MISSQQSAGEVKYLILKVKTSIKTPRHNNKPQESREKKYKYLTPSTRKLAMSKNPSIIPENYQTPAFPSLYSLIPPIRDEPQYLYRIPDIWRFTLFWTIIFFQGFHLAASGYAVMVQWRNWKTMWLVPVVYMLVAGVEAVLAGSVVGLM